MHYNFRKQKTNYQKAIFQLKVVINITIMIKMGNNSIQQLKEQEFGFKKILLTH